MDFTTSNWMSMIAEGQTVTRTVDGNIFSITHSTNGVFINGFPVTVEDWNNMLGGNKITLITNGAETSLLMSGKNILFDGKSFLQGKNISSQISFLIPSGPDSKYSGTGRSIYQFINLSIYQFINLTNVLSCIGHFSHYVSPCTFCPQYDDVCQV